MATYALGDLQGCFTALNRLIETIQFNPAKDRLWLVGDLVNRGPDSLSVLRYIKNLGDAAIMVLGNHDLHLLAVAAGIADLHRKDTLQDILHAPDSTELLHWLRHQRMLFRESRHVMVHAGLLPQWTIDRAAVLAHEVEQALRSDEYPSLLKSLYRNRGCAWHPDLPFPDRLGIITNVLTRMRVCSQDGVLDLSYKGPPDQSPNGYVPWFHISPQSPREETIIFGHWSALGFLYQDRYIALDGGCVWGKDLFAIRLEDRQLFQVSCSDSAAGQ